MIFELSSINVISTDLGLRDDDFWVNIQVDITKIGGHGAETFNVNVIGPARIKKITEHEYILGRGFIISNEFNELAVQTVIKRLLQKITVSNWKEFCEEFEKYFDRL